MWVRLGWATVKLDLGLGSGSPARCSVHTPEGPRKSGMPQLVEMPAPVKATMDLLLRTCRQHEAPGSFMVVEQALAADAVSCNLAHQLCKGLDLGLQEVIAVKELSRSQLAAQILSVAELLCIPQRHLLLFVGTGTSIVRTAST